MVVIKNVAIFGSTGMTGQCALNSAVEHGMNIKVLVRNPSRLPEEFQNKSNIEVIVGNVLNLEDCKKTVQGQDGVVVVLGTNNYLGPTTELSEGLKNIVSAMKEAKVSIISVCLSAFLFLRPDHVPKLFTEINDEHQRMFSILKESQLDWIAVFPPHITEDPPSKFTVKHSKAVGTTHGSLSPTITKYDLGAFLVESLSDPKHYGKTCGIANIPMVPW